MFSSNQILDITCEPRDLAAVIRFAVDLYGNEIFTRSDGRMRMAFSEPVPGVYALGRGSMRPYKTGPNRGWAAKLGKGWTDFPFDYDPEIVARIAAQWLEGNPPDPFVRPRTDGSARPGLRVRSLRCVQDELPPPHELPNWDWMDAVVFLTPCWLSYDK